MIKKFLFAIFATLLLISGGTADAKFLQPDWFEVTDPMVGTNRYAYSFNDPINLSDPSGNAPDYGYNTPGSYYCGCSNGYYDDDRNLRTDDSRPNNDHNRFIDNFNAGRQYVDAVKNYRKYSGTDFTISDLANGLNTIANWGGTYSPGSGEAVEGFFELPISAAALGLKLAASQVIKKVPNTELAKTIANGHAFSKHRKEFARLGIKSTRQLARHIRKIINKQPSVSKTLARGRTAYWDDKTKTVVIVDPQRADLGTAFVPWEGRRYFDELKTK